MRLSISKRTRRSTAQLPLMVFGSYMLLDPLFVPSYLRDLIKTTPLEREPLPLLVDPSRRCLTAASRLERVHRGHDANDEADGVPPEKGAENGNNSLTESKALVVIGRDVACFSNHDHENDDQDHLDNVHHAIYDVHGCDALRACGIAALAGAWNRISAAATWVHERRGGNA